MLAQQVYRDAIAVAISDADPDLGNEGAAESIVSQILLTLPSPCIQNRIADQGCVPQHVQGQVLGVRVVG